MNGRLMVAWTMLLTGGCGTPASQGEARTTTSATDNDAQGKAIAQRIGLTLPTDAVIEHAEAIRGQDDAARLVLVLPEAGRKAMAQQRAANDPAPLPFEADANFHLGPDGAGWTPGKAAGLTTTQLVWRGGTEALNIGSAPAAGKVRVFLFWHQL